MGPLDAAKAALKATPLLGEEDEFDPFAGRPKDLRPRTKATTTCTEVKPDAPADVAPGDQARREGP